MNFPNVQVLSAGSRSEFFGENLRWKTLVEITVEGSFLALSSTTYNAIHAQLNSLENSLFADGVQFYQSLTVNGVVFGNGYVSNFSSSPEGSDINDKKYTATIVIPEDGSINATVEGLTGGIGDPNFKYLESFSESSTFTKGEGIKDSYSQTISLSVIPPQKSDGSNIAKTIIQKFISQNSLTSLINGQYQKSVKKYYEQDYDPITNSYSFNINYDLYPRETNSTDNVLVTQNISIQYNNDGVITATENGECVGNIEGSVQDRVNIANSKAKELIDNAYNTLNSAYNNSKYGALIDTPTSTNFTSVVFEGRVSYSISYTTSKELIEEQGFWEYSADIEISDGGDITASEEGTITGVGKINLEKTKYNKALVLFLNRKTGIKSRLSEYVKGNKTLKKISSSVTHSETQGIIRYNETYSSNDSIQESGDFKKIVTTITEDYNRKLFSTFNIVSNKEIAQIQRNLLENNTTYNIVLNGKSSLTLSDYLSKAKSLITKNGYISDVSFSFSPSEREFNLNLTYFMMPSV
jgi:hypothetical protein